MKIDRKGLHIRTILNYPQEENAKKNKILQDQNLWSEQLPFDKPNLFLKLAFMMDAEILKIVSKIC